MTGRIRTLKPEWLEDEMLASSSTEARLLSVALILVADDHGRGRGSVPELAMAAWRFDMAREDGAMASTVLARTREALRELSELRFVEVYRVDGQSYFAIRNWTKHQKVDHPSKPRIPEPPTDSPTVTTPREPQRGPSPPPREGSREPSATLAPLTSDLRPPTSTSDRRPPTSASPPSVSRGSPKSPEPSFASMAEAAWTRVVGERGGAWAPDPSTDGPRLRSIATIVDKTRHGHQLGHALELSARAFLAQRTSGRGTPQSWLEWLQREASAGEPGKRQKRARGQDPERYAPMREWEPAPESAPDNVVPIGTAAAGLLAVLGLKAPTGDT